MSDRMNICILAALHGGDETLATRVGDDEADRAAARCAHRIERAISAHGGRLIEATRERTLARFDDADAAIQAAVDALDRIRNLPPLRGRKHPARLGVHVGALSTEMGKPSGEGVVQALRIANQCEAEQALASAQAIARLGSAARHLVASRPVAGLDTSRFDVTVHEIGHGKAEAVRQPLAQRNERLQLRHRNGVVHVEEIRPVVLLGRELGNDIVIGDPRASRQHARIERRHEGFILFDESTNGTYVAVEGQVERLVRQDRLLLTGQGRIGCGFTCEEGDEREIVFFDFE